MDSSMKMTLFILLTVLFDIIILSFPLSTKVFMTIIGIQFFVFGLFMSYIRKQMNNKQ